MRKAKILPGQGLAVTVADGAAEILDGLAAKAAGSHAFLRRRWFLATAAESIHTLIGRRPDATVIAAIPTAARGAPGLKVQQVPGSYWPFRSFPIANDASDAELTDMLASAVAHAALGGAWRIGPLFTTDPVALRLPAIAAAAGWKFHSRSLGTCFELDLKGLRAGGQWPRPKTLAKNRWFERQLAQHGELEFQAVRGDDWTLETLDALAAIEGESWVAAAREAGDTKFLRPEERRIWESLLRDPVLASMLSCDLLFVGGVPSAFVFSLTSGTVRYVIANSYSARLSQCSPGRILLYRSFQEAAEQGVETISWGAGDTGYKTQMGAQPGPEIVDLLIVRGASRAALARLLWGR